MTGSESLIDWLLAGDPAVRYGVMRYLLDADDQTLAREQASIATGGWGARLLERQDPAGTWSGALYSPKYTSTHYTLLTLRRLGLPRADQRARAAARVLLDAGFRDDHGVNYSSAPGSRAETCITGMCLSLLSYFGLEDERVHQVAGHLIGEQMPDGGWNCRRHRGATHSSFHTTTSALEGLLDYQEAHPAHSQSVATALERGREFLLQHRLHRSHRTGEVVSETMTRFPFPPMWQHDVLRALEHFAAAGAPHDERAADAIELVRSKRDGDGRYPQFRGPSGQYFFSFETVGTPSRMNTMRALRVLRWWGAPEAGPTDASSAPSVQRS